MKRPKIDATVEVIHLEAQFCRVNCTSYILIGQLDNVCNMLQTQQLVPLLHVQFINKQLQVIRVITIQLSVIKLAF